MSNKKKHQMRQTKLALLDASNKLSEEIWESTWDKIPGIHANPIGECTEIIQELEKRCPGYSPEEYKDAYAMSMFTWR
jgi:hypothetical protein